MLIHEISPTSERKLYDFCFGDEETRLIRQIESTARADGLKMLRERLERIRNMDGNWDEQCGPALVEPSNLYAETNLNAVARIMASLLMTPDDVPRAMDILIEHSTANHKWTEEGQTDTFISGSGEYYLSANM